MTEEEAAIASSQEMLEQLKSEKIPATTYTLKEMLVQLKADGNQIFQMQSGGLYGVAGNKKTGEPVCFVRVDKDRTPPKLRKRARRALKQAQK